MNKDPSGFIELFTYFYWNLKICALGKLIN